MYGDLWTAVLTVLAVQARCGDCVKDDRGDGGAVLAVAGLQQGSGRADGRYPADRGDGAQMC